MEQQARRFVFYSSRLGEYVEQERKHEGINYWRKAGGKEEVIKGERGGFKATNHEH